MRNTPSTAVEARAAGASLAPGAQPGLPQMVVTVAHNSPAPGQWGLCSKAKRESGSGHCSSKGSSVWQTGKHNGRFCVDPTQGIYVYPLRVRSFLGLRITDVGFSGTYFASAFPAPYHEFTPRPGPIRRRHRSI